MYFPEATGPNNGKPPESDYYTSEWVRSYGNYRVGTTCGWGTAVRTHKWGKREYGNWHIGAWGVILAKNLLEKHGMPICMVNGAVGGTRIDQHQRNAANPNDEKTIYGRLLTRIQTAKLTHGIRGVLWHQGENNSGAESPTGDWDYKSYQQYFADLSAAWKQDFPNIQHYYVFQVWPLPCSMGPKDDELRNVQRTLPSLYSNLRTMSTLGILSGSSGRGLCHYDLEGYAQIAHLITPLVSQDNYGLKAQQDMSSPNIRRAWFTSAAKDEIALDFGQAMKWTNRCKIWIYIDGKTAPISSGKVAGNVITLQLKSPTEAKTIAYISGRFWDGRPDDKLLYGTNGIAALTFCALPLTSSKGD